MNAGCIVFRADAGLDIGTGHVMRCLTLADALRAEGAEAVFVTREHRGHVIPVITDRNHRVVVLPGNTGMPYGTHPAPPDHAHWLEADWREDAAATRAALVAEGAGWLVMDHYALDHTWQEAALPEGVRLMVIDDLSDRPHMADLLLDQNAGQETVNYDGLVPEACTRLVGPAHALLRPEFARLRPEALARRKALERPEHLLITLGGIDRDNATGAVLEALAKAAGIDAMRLTVVMGRSAPWLGAVRARAAEMPCPTEVAVNVTDMAKRMTRADLCVGAAGSTAWERCALGLPTLQTVLADNQAPAARCMAEQGLSLALPATDELGFADALSEGLKRLRDGDTYRAMARRSAALTDGSAATRFAAHLLEKEHA